MTEQQNRRIRLDKNLRELVQYLREERAHGVCEICSLNADFRGLQGAHIERRARDGSNDTPENIVIACGRCHDHSKYKNGLAIHIEECLRLVEARNIKYNIKI